MVLGRSYKLNCVQGSAYVCVKVPSKSKYLYIRGFIRIGQIIQDIEFCLLKGITFNLCEPGRKPNILIMDNYTAYACYV